MTAQQKRRLRAAQIRWEREDRLRGYRVGKQQQSNQQLLDAILVLGGLIGALLVMRGI